jgi:hypothetical protein
MKNLPRLLWIAIGITVGISLAFWLVTPPLSHCSSHRSADLPFAWSRICPGMVRYPVKWLERSPPSTSWGGWD